MDRKFQFLYRAKAWRQLIVIALVFGIILVVQYFELPYRKAFSPMLSIANFSGFQSKGPSVKFEVSQNLTLSNGMNTSISYIAAAVDVNSSTVSSDVAQGNKFKEVSISPLHRAKFESHRASLDNRTGLNANNSALEFSAMEQKHFRNQDASLTPEKPHIVNDNKPLAAVSNTKVSARKANIDERPKVVQGKGPPSGYNIYIMGVPVPEKVITISEMNNLLLKSRTLPSSLTLRESSKADRELLFAKSQILNPPIAKNDKKLYVPLYHNFSMFKRSYELMENILKVYVYKDGKKPIFHNQELKGIYASEGWFMKLMEANKKFVTRDPEKAHLFYLPFSSRMLQVTFYDPMKKNHDDLIQYMKVYEDMIATKYPFWNRTNGADHFLVACHDWAPAETIGRMNNCIRALCVSDTNFGFTIGKDVTLPETNVRTPEKPVKNLGGYPPSQRTTLAFFAGGRTHGYLRPILLKHWENKDPDMKIYGRMPPSKGDSNYIQLMKSSKFCLCPRGYKANSPRLVEAIFFECVPVIIADNYVPPLSEVLNWDRFAVFVMEKDVSNLKNILVSISEKKYVEMHKMVKKVQHHFLWHTKPVKYDLFHMILHSVWYNRVFR